ncbi:hypothetical protein PHSY_003621 [Pseudozyma hubeiensis SY62]|uniref:Nab2 type CCCH zinc finger 4 domain-containing protein n=1 Tax=Pseudozyma hubeiensis (strain SY62) TaxID=1305764 RepID=R9P459_PSEHS|nr:hypothetical protein PHSY_003621 [Pseudozyma hubeiensis SY62]GAC96042.1 hypothetical protein PHSY_003621 [Pseudozyma hubeiensis SY62]
MSHFRIADVKAPNIQQLQASIQGQLAQHGYSSEDDPVMAEYIVVMLANQKTAEQITAEMKELIGGEYDAGFTEWVWTETERWVGEGGEASVEVGASAVEGTAQRRTTRQRRSRSPQRAVARDQRRSRSPVGARREERRRSRSPPTQPQRREDVRHRMPRDHSSYEAWKASTAPRRQTDEPFDGEAFWRKKAQEKRTNPPPPVNGGARETRIFNAAYDQAVRNSLETHSSENAQRELFPDSTASDDPPPPPYPASNGVSIFGRAGIPDPRAPEFIPSSSSSTEPSTSASPSIFARIDPMLPNNQPLPPPQPSAPTHSNDFPTAPTSTSICRWNLNCTNPVCIYSHASPANAGPGAGDTDALVLSQQNCRYGAECGDRECTRAHRTGEQTVQVRGGVYARRLLLRSSAGQKRRERRERWSSAVQVRAGMYESGLLLCASERTEGECGGEHGGHQLNDSIHRSLKCSSSSDPLHGRGSDVVDRSKRNPYRHRFDHCPAGMTPK